jgi:hypothetical protein
MSDEHSFSLRDASAEYRDFAGKLRELARACVFPAPRRNLSRLAGSFDRRATHFDARGRAVIGETPEWMLWVLVALLIVVMCLPVLKR